MPIAPKAQRAATKSFHFCRLRARVPIVPQVWWWLFSSCSTVCHQVIFGRPLFLFPSGVQCRAVLMMHCAAHVQSITSVFSWLLWPCLVCSGTIGLLLEILFGQNTLSYSPEVLGMEWGQLGEVLLCHSPALCSVEEYWYNTAVEEF